MIEPKVVDAEYTPQELQGYSSTAASTMLPSTSPAAAGAWDLRRPSDHDIGVQATPRHAVSERLKGDRSCQASGRPKSRPPFASLDDDGTQIFNWESLA